MEERLESIIQKYGVKGRSGDSQFETSEIAKNNQWQEYIDRNDKYEKEIEKVFTKLLQEQMEEVFKSLGIEESKK